MRMDQAHLSGTSSAGDWSLLYQGPCLYFPTVGPMLRVWQVIVQGLSMFNETVVLWQLAYAWPN